jgi:hypothetical protein
VGAVVLLDHVEVVLREVVVGRCRERLAPDDTEVAAPAVAERLEALATTTSMSMIGLAASPGTDVEPTWSMRTATSASTDHARDRSASNDAGHRGS